MSKSVKIHNAKMAGDDTDLKDFELEVLSAHPTTRLNLGKFYFHGPTDRPAAIGANGIIKPLAYLADIPTAVNGKDGSILYLGALVPANNTGGVLDTYIHTTTGDYYTKGSGVWAKSGNLKGPKGDAGVDGASVLSGITDPAVANGKDGDSYVNLVSGDTFKRTAGAWGKTGNLKGPKGDSSSPLGSVLKYNLAQGGILTGTSVIPSRDSAPVQTDGTEVWRYTQSATEIGSLISISFHGLADCVRRNTKIFFVLFRDGNVLDWGAVTSGNNSNGSPTSFLFKYMGRSQDLNPHTYTIRIGTDISTTWYIGRGIDKKMGDINECYFVYEEKKV